MAFRRLSASDFELAWRLRPESWMKGIYRADLNLGKEYELTKKVLVDGVPATKLADNDFSIKEYVGLSRLKECARSTLHQIYVHEG